jgi:hypothetical protein
MSRIAPRLAGANVFCALQGHVLTIPNAAWISVVFPPSAEAKRGLAYLEWYIWMSMYIRELLILAFSKPDFAS